MTDSDKEFKDPLDRFLDGEEGVSEFEELYSFLPADLSEHNSWAAVSRIEKFLGEIQKHFESEEETVFLAVETADAPEDLKALVARLRKEHKEILERSAMLKELLSEEVFPMDDEALGKANVLYELFKGRLLLHAKLEDESLYPHIKPYLR